MIFCPICSTRLGEGDMVCPECGTHIYEEDFSPKVEEKFELHPRFVFMYELLPSCLQTTWLLLLLFVVAIVARNYFHLQPTIIIAFFAFLLLIKDLKIFYRKFRYRNVEYIITNNGIEYNNTSKNIQYFIPYENITNLKMQRNLATILFGYGHILVRDRESGIYLDYIANVEKVYDYIYDHMKH